MKTTAALAAFSLAAALPVGAAAAVPFFEERAAAAGLDFVHWNGMTGARYFAENMGAGAALVDIDGDGDMDVYLVQGNLLGERPAAEAIFPPPGPLPLTDRLFRNDLVREADGRVVARFVDVTEAAGLAGPDGATGYGFGVAVGDANGDGLSDLYVTNLGANQLWMNDGDGTFTERAAAAGVAGDGWSVPAVFFDLDADGDQDLFVGDYVRYSTATDRSCPDLSGAADVRDYCGPLSYPAAENRLYENRGDGTFDDATARSGLTAVPAGRTLGAVSLDVDRDGYADLYVANDMSANELWMNRPGPDGGRRLVDEALLAGAGVNLEGRAEASMGIAPADADGDGLFDLFVTHLTGETHTLYTGRPGAVFSDRTLPAGLALPTLAATGFGAVFLDADRDGRLDLLVANGAVRNLSELVRVGDPYPLAQRDQLFRGTGGGRFEEVAPERAGAAFERPAVGRWVARGDVDADGDADAVVTANSGPVRLLLARAGDGSPWLGAVVPVGTRVELVEAGGAVRVARSHADGSYASASDPRVLFGLGDEGEAPRALRLAPERPGAGTLEVRRPPVGVYLVFPELPGGEEMP